MERLRGKPWFRGVVTVALVGALGAGVMMSPVGAAFNPTKKKVKKIAQTQAKKYFNKNIGGASVANATNAGDADTVNGVSVDRFFFQAPPNTTDAVIGTFGPITLKATCDGSGDPTLRASWNEETNNMKFVGSTASQSGNSSTAAGATTDLGSGVNGTVGFSHAIGFTSKVHTLVEYFLRDSAALGVSQCFYSGYVTVA